MQLIQYFPERIAKIIKDSLPEQEHLQELRMRAGQPLIIRCGGKELFVTDKGKLWKVELKDIRDSLEALSSYSLYMFEDEMKKGFLTIRGGHRIGITGKVICENGKIASIRNISGLNIRFAAERIGCAEQILPYLADEQKRMYHTLIISPPGAGKTTLLRDLIRQISNGTEYINGTDVGVVDERSEIGGSWMGIAQNDLGMRTDLLDCCPKEEGMMMLLRSMAPRVIAVDELGGEKDIIAVEQALYCGCRILATIHGTSYDEIKRKNIWRKIYENEIFDRYIVLYVTEKDEHAADIYDGRGQVIAWNVRF